MDHSRRAVLGVAVTAAATAGYAVAAGQGTPAKNNKNKLVGDGVKDDAPTLAAMLQELAAGGGGRLTLSSGEYRLAADVTVPPRVELEFDGSARVMVDSGATLTIEGRVAAPAHQIFHGGVTLGTGSSQVLWPQWWGAIGDGEADDAGPIQAALNAVRDAGGGEVELLRGRYLISTILRIYQGTTVRSDPHAVILRGAATSGIFINGDEGATYPGYEGHGDITLEGGTLDGNIQAFPDAYSAVSIGHAANIVVRDVEFRDVSWAHALEINSSTHVLIEDCRFLGYLDAPDASRYFSEAIQLDIPTSLSFPAFGAWDGTPTRDVTIRRNRFGASGTPGTAAWPCGVGEHGAVHDVFTGEVRIEGNTFDGATYYAVRTFQWRDIQVIGNLFTNCAGGVALSTATPNSLSTQDVDGVQQGNSQPNSRVMIANNIFRDTGGSGAVAAYGRDHALNDGLQVVDNLIENCGGSGVRVSFARALAVRGNTIRNSRRGIHVDGLDDAVISGNLITDTVVNGLEVIGGTAMIVTHNTVHRAGFYGALFTEAGSRTWVSDNVIMGPSLSESGRYDGIFLSGTISGGEVARNHVIPADDAAIRHGVQIGAANSALMVGGNVSPVGTSSLHDLAADSPDALRLVSANGTRYTLAIDDAGELVVNAE